MFEDLIDFPVSPTWRRHYASQGLTTQPGGSYSDDRVVEALDAILLELRRRPDDDVPPRSYHPYEPAPKKNTAKGGGSSGEAKLRDHE